MGAPRGNCNAAKNKAACRARKGKSNVAREVNTFGQRSKKAYKSKSLKKYKPGTKAWTDAYFRAMRSAR